MSRLPTPGADAGTWGDVLNDFLMVSHDSAGALASNSVSDTQISSVSQSKVSGLTTALAAKATDTAVVHLSGTETVTGDKNFTGALQRSGNTVATDNTVVHLSGTEIITGNKNFTGTLQSSGNAVATDTTVVHLAGTEVISGDKNFTGALQQNGSALATNASVVHLAGTETVTGDKNFTGAMQHNGNAVVDTTDIRLTNQFGYYPPQAYGFFSMSTLPELVNQGSSDSSGDAFFVRMWVPAGQAINGVSTYVKTAGTVGGGGVNGFAIYTDAGVLVDSTPSDNTLWSTIGWRSKAFSTPIAAQSSGRFVYTAFLINGYSGGPTMSFSTIADAQFGILSGGYTGVTSRRVFYQTGLSAFPSSFNPATFGTTTGFIAIFGLA